MKKMIIMLGVAGMVHIGAAAQNINNSNPVTSPDNSLNNTNNTYTTPGVPNCGYINPNYDHSPTYTQTPNCNTTNQTPIDNAPINNNNNNNTMTPFSNEISPYDNTSPYYTPPHTNAPLNNTPPEK